MQCAHELSKFIAIVQKYWMPYQLPQNRERVFLPFLCVGHLTLHLLQQLILPFYAWVIHITRPSTINFTFFVCGSSDFKPPSTVNFIHFTFHFTVTFHSVFHLGKFLVSKPCLSELEAGSSDLPQLLCQPTSPDSSWGMTCLCYFITKYT